IFSSLGLAVGLLSGLLGIGGGMILIPALMVCFSRQYTLAQLTGFAALQTLAAGLSGSFVHWRAGNLSWPFVLWIALFAIPGAYLGGWLTAWIPEIGLLVMLIMMQGLNLILFWRRKPDTTLALADAPFWPIVPSVQKWLAPSSFIIGVIAGLFGIGGAVFMVPLLHDRLHVCLRKAIGIGSGLVLMTAVATVTSKIQSGQVALMPALMLAFSGLLGAWIGARLSRVASAGLLKIGLSGVMVWGMVQAALRMWV
ncbi:MAG: sulfite exporter TauE/SafE family protein, partial [Vampirovibrionales bacterium]|nr:sulfite exporter TauE/SafE family protein [Vampirovibrionales bacterium]